VLTANTTNCDSLLSWHSGPFELLSSGIVIPRSAGQSRTSSEKIRNPVRRSVMSSDPSSCSLEVRADVTTAPSLGWHRPRWLGEGLTSCLRFRAVRIIPLIHILEGSKRLHNPRLPSDRLATTKADDSTEKPQGKIRSVGGTYGSLGNHLS